MSKLDHDARTRDARARQNAHLRGFGLTLAATISVLLVSRFGADLSGGRLEGMSAGILVLPPLLAGLLFRADIRALRECGPAAAKIHKLAIAGRSVLLLWWLVATWSILSDPLLAAGIDKNAAANAVVGTTFNIISVGALLEFASSMKRSGSKAHEGEEPEAKDI